MPNSDSVAGLQSVKPLSSRMTTASELVSNRVWYFCFSVSSWRVCVSMRRLTSTATRIASRVALMPSTSIRLRVAW